MRSCRRAVATLAAALLLPGAASAKVQAVIVAWGEVDAVPGKPLGEAYQQHSLGVGHQLLAARYVNHESELAAQLCRRFGITAWLAPGAGDAMPDRVLARLRHPTLTRPDGISSAEDSLSLLVADGKVGDAWSFEEPYEVQAGQWVFELLLGGEVLASKAFTLRPPGPGDVAPPCPDRPVS